MIPVDQVMIGERLRGLSAPDVEQLADSMRELGLLQPITVQQADDGYPLVAGRHRLEAARRLGWREIAAIVQDLDEVDRRLAGLIHQGDRVLPRYPCPPDLDAGDELA